MNDIANVSVTPLVKLLPLGDVHEDPNNPRKTFREVEELAENISKHGVLQPILCRAMPKGKSGHMIVFGARRYRAAKLAKLAEIPVMERELDDKQALELQIVENSQRDDVHPLEEAEGYERLHKDYGFTIEDIAAKVGKSTGTIYGRLKLCELIPAARKACYDGALSSSVALFVARVPKDLQPAALKAVTQRDVYGEVLTARIAQNVISKRFMLKLAEAPFDRGDTELVKKAGSCKDCPKRTGNQRELFADVKSADVCTDPYCYAEKKSAHLVQEVAKLKANGVTIVGKVDPKMNINLGYVPIPDGYTNLDHEDWDTAKARFVKLRDLVKRAKIDVAPTVMFDAKGHTIDLIPDSIANKLRSSLQKSDASHMGKSTERGKFRNLAVLRCLGKIADAAEKKGPDRKVLLMLLGALTVFSWHDELKRLCVRRAWTKKGERPGETVKAHLPKLKDVELRGMLVELLAGIGAPGSFSETPRHAFAEACKLYRVNWTKELSIVKAEAKEKKKAKAATQGSKHPVSGISSRGAYASYGSSPRMGGRLRRRREQEGNRRAVRHHLPYRRGGG